jgi:hypothetical protein
MNKTFKISTVLFSFVLMIACGGGGGGEVASPTTSTILTTVGPTTVASTTTTTTTVLPSTANFVIISVAKTMTTFNRPSLTITVNNNGTATGYNVSCDAHARNSAGTIIDTAQAFFAGLGNIVVGDSALDEAVFFNLNTHTDYVSITYDCSWLTRR